MVPGREGMRLASAIYYKDSGVYQHSAIPFFPGERLRYRRAQLPILNVEPRGRELSWWMGDKK